MACSLIIWLTYAYVNRSLEKAELDGFNRQMGALVGAFLGILLCMVVTMFSVSLLGQRAHDSIHYSKFGPYVLRGISMVHTVVPEELSASLDPHFDRFYQQTGYDPNQPVDINSFPAYQNSGVNSNSVAGGSEYNNVFNPSSGQSYQGNWSTSPATGQNQNPYANVNQQPNYNQTQTQAQARYSYQPNANNQGTNYLPQAQQPAPTQPSQGYSLPVEIKLDETILNGAGRLLRDRLTNPNGN